RVPPERVLGAYERAARQARDPRAREGGDRGHCAPGRATGGVGGRLRRCDRLTAVTSTDDSAVPSYPELLRLDGRGFVVVGAGQGIGRQTCHALAQAGAKVFCIDNVETLAKEVADEVGGVPWSGDARDRGDVERSVEMAQ